MRSAVILLGLMLALSVKADIYKCTVNGNTSFSDQPCSKQAEIIEIDSRKPDQQAVQNQQTITQRFREESRVNQVHALKRRNDELSSRIERLQQDRQTELNQLRQRTYTTEDGRMATREQGLFEQMDRVDAEYQQQIRDLKSQMQKNQQEIHQLYQ
ncbi:MAG: DUF4124 domain-containing protein [Pseudomonadota bacterium]|nr:DUF4124 domain-containing protein [Pseudomonadota bacterium]